MDDFELYRKDRFPYSLFNSSVSQPFFLLIAPIRSLFRLFFSNYPFLKFQYQRYTVFLFMYCIYTYSFYIKE